MRVAVYVLVISCLLFTCSFAGESATPEEVLEKTLKCALFIEQTGKAGLDALQHKEKNEFIWKDSYVHAYGYINDPSRVKILVHQFMPHLREWDSNKVWNIKDTYGNYIVQKICKAALSGKNGGWVEYWWPKPGQTEPSRKITYAIRVPGTDVAVHAGIYDDKATIEELNALTMKVMARSF